MRIIITVNEYTNEDGQPFELSFSTRSEALVFINDFLYRGYTVTIRLEVE